MAEIKSILVNGKQYKVQMMSVLDTIDLQIETVSSLGGFISELAKIWVSAKNGENLKKQSFEMIFKGLNVEAIKPFKKKILAQVITPENQFLSDESEIEKWFGRPENRGDVWEVLVKATAELLGEYLPNFLREIVDQGMEKVQAAKFQSQNGLEQKPSSITQSSTT